MSLDTDQRRAFLKQGKFAALFNNLGWDRFNTKTSVTVGEETFALSPVAEKHGVQIFAVTGTNGALPPSPTRRKIEREVTKIAAEHLLIFHDAAFKEQVWQWIARAPHRPAQVRELPLRAHQSGEALLQKLDRISFALSEEESLSIVAVVTKLTDAFDRDKVTKAFYTRFQNEHKAFHDLIAGITDAADQRWYASVMINRIMFLYFVQSKGFLNGDPNYLKNRLAQSEKKYGADKFYQSFLCPLFFEGLAKRESERDPTISADLGKLPYLSGSLFVGHEIEARTPTIDFPDAAFIKLFAFLGEYNWHLDDRPVADGKHINPDVLGYIFEKYINQKQMGAYYTKEDITEYISKNTILPFVLERTKEKCEVAFTGEYSVWRLLSEDPDRYIYPAVRHGMDWPLPENIAEGVFDVSKRGDWNKPAPLSHALPTEIWREAVARRLRYSEVRETLKDGEVVSASDLITLNLDIRQFVQDMVERSEGADLLRAVWETLNGSKDGSVPPLSVLDPTCGSGAFLFAAVEILQPLYTACVERMRGFVDDADRLGHKNEHKAFRDTLAEMANHSNESYYILKKIITHNLFGVDIMDEATEICKLRLFLKLAAQVDPDVSKDNMGIEPLPDIDFNIRAGNTLVGFATEKQMHNAVSGSLALDGEDAKWAKFKADLEVYDYQFEKFLEMQEEGTFSSAVAETTKKALRDRIQPLRDQADTLLGHQYGKISAAQRKDWRATAKPFHWFVEFYRTLRAGGFDCIIGNPPYVEYTKKDAKTKRSVADEYTLKGYTTLPCGNLYAFVMELCLGLVHKQGMIGVIVPVSSIATEGYKTLQQLMISRDLHFSSFDDRPSRLFENLEHIRLTIHLIGMTSEHKKFYSSRYNKWSSAERHALFQKLSYVPSSYDNFIGCFPKLSSDIEHDIRTKLWKSKTRFMSSYTQYGSNIYYTRKSGYFLQFLDFIPNITTVNGDKRKPSELKSLTFRDQKTAQVALSVLNSNLFFWLFTVLSDCRNVNKREIDFFPVDPADLASSSIAKELTQLSSTLMQDIDQKSEYRLMKSGSEAITVQCTLPKYSKSIIDEIDRVLGKHYGFTNEELDFIINYDIKYRVGRGGNIDEAEAE